MTDHEGAGGRRDRAAALQVGVGLVLAALVVVPIVLAPFLDMPDPTKISLTGRLMPPGTSGHPLGTDQLGRDFLSRLVWGGRQSLLIGFLAIIAAGTLGVAAGVSAGHFGGRTDTIISRLIEAQLSIPGMMLILMMVAVLGQSLIAVVLVIGLAGWPLAARIARGSTLVEREKLYVTASRAIGAKTSRIVLRHILPNIGGQVVVVLMLLLASAILLESSLSFLGFGVQRPFPSWGQILGDGKQYMTTAWWLVVLPGIAIAAVVVGVNLIGDSARQLLSGDDS